MSKQHKQKVIQPKAEYSRAAVTGEDNDNYLVLYGVRHIGLNFFPREVGRDNSTPNLSGERNICLLSQFHMSSLQCLPGYV